MCLLSETGPTCTRAATAECHSRSLDSGVEFHNVLYADVGTLSLLCTPQPSHCGAFCDAETRPDPFVSMGCKMGPSVSGVPSLNAGGVR